MEVKKKKNANTGLYITLVLILIALAVGVATTTVAGKKSAELSAEKADTDAYELMENGGDTSVVLKDTEKEETEKTEDTEAAKTPDTEDTDSSKGAESAAIPDEAESDAEDVAAEPENALPEFSSPVAGIVTSSFSDTTPVFSSTMNDYRIHTGVDVSAEEGEAVMACADGIIGAVYDDPLMGTCMTVVHSGGVVSTYKGLYSTLPDGIAAGVSVERGQVIAAAGDSALIEVAEEPHLHFELAVDGVSVDPCLYITFDGAESFEG